MAVLLPRFDTDVRWGYYKFCRKPGEFALASCAAVFGPAPSSARLVIGAQDGTPQELGQLAEQVAQGGFAAATPTAIDEALAAAMPGKDAIERKIFASVVRRCLEQAHGLREVA